MYKKIVLALVLLVSGVDLTLAQHSGSEQDEKACSRDAVRFCRKVIDQGDFAVLACLQQNRKKLSHACLKVLVDHGQ